MPKFYDFFFHFSSPVWKILSISALGAIPSIMHLSSLQAGRGNTEQQEKIQPADDHRLQSKELSLGTELRRLIPSKPCAKTQYNKEKTNNFFSTLNLPYVMQEKLKKELNWQTVLVE